MVREPSFHSWRETASDAWFQVCRQRYLWLIASLVIATHCQAADIVNSYITRGRSDAQFKEDLNRQAIQTVTEVRRACGLSGDQAEKLQRAALGDISRAMQEIGALRHAIDRLDTADANQMRTAFQLMQPLMVRIQNGLHEKDSLFAKYLEHLLDEPQKETYQQYIAHQEKQRHHVIALSTVAALNERVPLLKAQREKLVELIDKRPIPKINRNAESMSGYIRLSGVPEHELTEFLDEAQTEFIVKICAPYQAMGW